MGINTNVTLGRFSNGSQIFTNIKLSIVPFVSHNAVFINAFYFSAIRNITGFNLSHTVFFIQIKCISHLIFIIDHCTRCFMMTNQTHIFLQSVTGDFRQIKIRISFGKTKNITIAVPISVPTYIPTFNQYTVETVLRSEIH